MTDNSKKSEILFFFLFSRFRIFHVNFFFMLHAYAYRTEAWLLQYAVDTNLFRLGSTNQVTIFFFWATTIWAATFIFVKRKIFFGRETFFFWATNFFVAWAFKCKHYDITEPYFSKVQFCRKHPVICHSFLNFNQENVNYLNTLIF